MMKLSLRTISGLLVIVILFIGAEFLANTYTKEITSLMESLGMGGQLFFIAMAMIAVIIPVWSNIFLLPFGVMMWGPFFTAILCILGWWMGSIVSFFIARTYQEWLLGKYPSLKKYQLIDSLVPDNKVFFSLIFLRMTMPVDVLSYALGLFSRRISWKLNAITTSIGIMPFAFVFSYIGVLSPLVQVLIFITTTSLFIGYVIIQKRKRKSDTV